jgi:integrase
MTEPKRRQRRQMLTDKQVASLPRRRRRYFHPDPELPGHGVRVLLDGPSSFYLIARDAFHKQRWVRLGSTAELTIADSREQARAVIKRLKAGLTPFEPPPVQPDTVADVCAGWLKRHVEAKRMRTGRELTRVLEKYVLPHWRDRPFAGIKRSDVAALLDHVEDHHGAWTADEVLAVLGSVSSWYATRHDDYVPPFVKGMRRVPAQARKRSRILNDDELRRVWQAAEGAGSFGAFVQLLLLTAQRREKVRAMRWTAVAEDGVWTIPTAPREKGNPGTLKLPPQAMKVLGRLPRMAGNPYVFPGRGDGPLGGYSDRHASFKALCNVDYWTLHDCRRTARSLMAKAGVSSEHAERVLGHAIAGVEGVYNRHDYTAEMADALKRLARLITQIVDGEGGKNVVPMRAPAVQP